MAGNDSLRSKLKAVSIDLLYEGMVLEEDVYDSDATRLIITHGTTLDADAIRRIRALNSNRSTIFVSGGTYKTLIANRPPIKVTSRSEMEKTTGYAAVKDRTFELLVGIARDKVVQQEALYSISAELSSCLEITSPSIIMSLINALAPVDEYLQRHCTNVSLLNGLISHWLGLPKSEVDKLVLIGLLHDCGKALIPPQVLNAPRKLTVVEFEVVKMHAVYTYKLLTDFPEPLRRSTSLHHERINGTGYPDRLSGDDIPPEARITAVSDIYDAMVSQRAYKEPRSPFSVMAILTELSGRDLDAGLVDVFIRNMPMELIDKPVKLSDGTIGVVRSLDPDDLEHPMIEVNGSVFKSGENLYCTSMHFDD